MTHLPFSCLVSLALGVLFLCQSGEASGHRRTVSAPVNEYHGGSITPDSLTGEFAFHHNLPFAPESRDLRGWRAPAEARILTLLPKTPPSQKGPPSITITPPVDSKITFGRCTPGRDIWLECNGHIVVYHNGQRSLPVRIHALSKSPSAHPAPQRLLRNEPLFQRFRRYIVALFRATIIDPHSVIHLIDFVTTHPTHYLVITERPPQTLREYAASLRKRYQPDSPRHVKTYQLRIYSIFSHLVNTLVKLHSADVYIRDLSETSIYIKEIATTKASLYSTPHASDTHRRSRSESELPSQHSTYVPIIGSFEFAEYDLKDAVDHNRRFAGKLPFSPPEARRIPPSCISTNIPPISPPEAQKIPPSCTSTNIPPITKESIRSHDAYSLAMIMYTLLMKFLASDSREMKYRPTSLPNTSRTLLDLIDKTLAIPDPAPTTPDPTTRPSLDKIQKSLSKIRAEIDRLPT